MSGTAGAGGCRSLPGSSCPDGHLAALVPVPVLVQGEVEEGQQAQHKAACDG